MTAILKRRALVIPIDEFPPNFSTRQIVSWVPTSTTRLVGIWKKSVASLADLASAMNSRSCQRGMPDYMDGLSARRDR